MSPGSKRLEAQRHSSKLEEAERPQADIERSGICSASPDPPDGPSQSHGHAVVPQRRKGRRAHRYGSEVLGRPRLLQAAGGEGVSTVSAEGAARFSDLGRNVMDRDHPAEDHNDDKN